MKLDDLKKEFVELSDDLGKKLRDATSEYQANNQNFIKNRNQALIGAGVGLIGSIIHPLLGLPGLAYSGIKAYQAYQDYKKL